MTGLRLPVETEKRLTHLAQATRRSKSLYIRQAIDKFLEDNEEYLLAAAQYEDYLKDGKQGISLEELTLKYNLNDTH